MVVYAALGLAAIAEVYAIKYNMEHLIGSSTSFGLNDSGIGSDVNFSKKENNQSNVGNSLKKNAQAPSAAAGSPAPDGNNNNDDEDEDCYESNPKHNQNSKSPEPKNAKEMFDKSVKDKSGRRWYKDKNGTLHRFMEHEKHKYHWNGKYEGKPSQMDGNVQKLYRSLPKGAI